MGHADEKIIKIEGLSFEYHSEERKISALESISLEIERGSFTSIIGRNGSGKSTLAKNINALLLPTEGCVIVGGYDTREEEYLWEIRRMAGMVFQNPDNQLVSAVVEDDVAFGPENIGLPREEIRERIRRSLEAVDMYEQRKMAPHLLSGGQKQRVAIAGVVAMTPDIIIFDEPTAMLDPEGRKEVLDIVRRLHEEGITVLLITHFMEETVESDRVIIMDQGKVRMDGKPEEVFAQAGEIEAMGLKLPFSVEIGARLRERGVIPPGAPILKDALLADQIAVAYSNGRHEPDNAPKSENHEQDHRHVSETAKDNEPIIRIEHLTHTYNKGLAYETSAVKDISLEINAGEYVAVIGHTGSGKSTLIQHLNGLLKPTSGTIIVGGINISEKNTSVIEMRKKIGMVFQYPEYQLFEETVYQDIAFGPKNLGLDENEIDTRVKEAMALVNIDFNEFAYRSPFELSGGQKRMVAIAGVLAMRPEVLVLDEPTASLDPKSHEETLDLISEIRKKTGCTIILVSHNMDDVAKIADRIFVMNVGAVAKIGAPDEVYSDEAFLQEIGLDVPRPTAFAKRLKHKGISFGHEILTSGELVEALS